jgi:hypothetical protein
MSRKDTQSASFVAVLDTNVFLDIFSCHDLISTFNAAHARCGEDAMRDPAAAYRLARARDSLLLAILLHDLRATTLGLHAESIELLTLRAPSTRGGETPESDFVMFFLHFVMDHLLEGWTHTVDSIPANVSSNAADRFLIAAAKEHGVPLITNEGYSKAGIANKKMRALASDEGVAAFSPREFISGEIDEISASASFLARFCEEAPGHFRDHDQEGLTWIEGYYRMILLGEASSRP